MATFPQAGLDVKYELALNNTWVDVTGDVYQRIDTSITRGQADEASSSIPSPSQCSFQLDNRLGNYSSRNPTGAYYGQLGRNTPVQVSVKVVGDAFTRSVSNAWGAADTGQAWFCTGAGGVLAASDFQVTGTAATQSVPAVSSYRQSTVSTAFADVDMTATWSMALASITGGAVEPCNIMFRRNPTTFVYYMVRTTVQAGGAIQLSLIDFGGLVIVPATATGLTYAAGTKYKVRARIEGRTFRAKIWLASAAEPLAWLVVGTDTVGSTPELIQAGGVGVRSGVSSSNTNALPIVFTYDDIEIRSMRFTGEVPEWPATVDVSGQDRYVSVVAGDPLRRLNAGSAPLRSPMFRGTMATSPSPIHYWPCEDGATTINASNAINPQYPFNVSGSPQWASFTGFQCSAPLPQLNNSVWNVWLPGYATTGAVQLRFLMRLPSGEIPNATALMSWTTNGTLPFWQFVYRTSGNLELIGYDQAGMKIVDNFTAFLTDDKMLRVDINLVQNGANIDWKYSTLAPVLGVGGSYTAGTATGQTVGAITSLTLNPTGVMKTSVVGQIMVNTTVQDLFAQSDQLNAYASEDAITRMVRLCREEGVELGLWAGKYGTGTTQPMGAQTTDTLLNLLGQCVDVDIGTLMGSRTFLGLMYRRHSELIAADAMLTASYAAHEFQPPFQPVVDDQRLRNDITVGRQNGGSFRAQQTTGALSTAAAPSGVGTYATSKTVNPQQDYQLGWIANWLLARGTLDYERYPAVALAREANAVVANATLSQALLNLAPGDHIQLTGLTKLGLYDTADQTVNQVQETINRFRHQFVLATAPEQLYHAAVLDIATHRLDSDSSTTGGTLTTTAATMSVATTSGPAVLWTTNAAHFPFDVMVAGERMTVTNCTGATSPQSMTVTRSVNGVVKTHVANEPVRLFDQRYVQV